MATQAKTCVDKVVQYVGQYILTLIIDAASLLQLNQNGYKLCLNKGTISNPSQGGAIPIIWNAFQAYQSNQVTWQAGQYCIYASDTLVNDGTVIYQLSNTETPADQTKVYTFKNGVFTQTADSTTPGYTCFNAQGNPLLFGLAQSVDVNGTTVNGPVGGMYLPNQSTGRFEASEAVSIFFYSNAQTSQCLSQGGTNPCVVVFSPSQPNITVTWDLANAIFVPTGPSAAHSKDVTIRDHIEPMGIVKTEDVVRVNCKRLDNPWHISCQPVAYKYEAVQTHKEEEATGSKKEFIREEGGEKHCIFGPPFWEPVSPSTPEWHKLDKSSPEWKGFGSRAYEVGSVNEIADEIMKKAVKGYLDPTFQIQMVQC